MAKDKRIELRLKELNRIFENLPHNKKILLSSTIDTVATMDIMLKDLEAIIASGTSTTPDKQLYSSTAKTRDTMIKRLLAELPPEETADDLSEFLS